jgi:hypothetical protein
LHTSALPDSTGTIAPDRPRRTPIVLAIAALLALLITTAANGTEHDTTSPGASEPTAAEEHAEPCATGEQAEVLPDVLERREPSEASGAALHVVSGSTPDAVFACLHPHVNCAL